MLIIGESPKEIIRADFIRSIMIFQGAQKKSGLLLGGRKDRTVHISQFSLLYMLNRFRYYIGSIIDVKNKKTVERKAEDLVFQENRNPNCCPELSDSGCRLPLGRRFAFCLIYIFPEMMQAMTWAEYFKYIIMSIRYFIYLTINLPKAINEIWKQRQ